MDIDDEDIGTPQSKGVETLANFVRSPKLPSLASLALPPYNRRRTGFTSCQLGIELSALAR